MRIVNQNDITSICKNLNAPTNYIVNLGCGDGVSDDPLYPIIMLNNDVQGLYIDGDQHKIQHCRTVIPLQINVVNDFVNPDNINSLFKKYNVPQNIDILKIDIDGYDLTVLKKILELGYTPKIIISEFNEKIPPSIYFDVHYDKSYKWDVSHFYGYSILAGKKVLEANNYFINSLYDINNILYVRKDHADLFDVQHPADINEIYQNQYIPNINRFPWNSNVHHWTKIENKNILKDEIIKYFDNIGHTQDQYDIESQA